MKKQTPILFLFLLSIFFAQCDYKKTEFEDLTPPCPDDTNPECPCPNPSNPNCATLDITFNELFPNSILGCSDGKANEVLELNNNSGYMVTGRCDASGFIFHVSDDASQLICNGTQDLLPDFNFFTSIARTTGNRLVTTGYTLGNGNTNVFNFLISPTACSMGEESEVDNTAPDVIQTWDHGNSIIQDAASDNLIVGGKWEGYPFLVRLTDNENMTTDDIEEIFVLDSTFFKSQTGVTIASVNSLPIDNGFLATGFVDAEENGEYVKKAFLVKTNPDFSGPVLRILDASSGVNFKNTWGFDLMEVDNGNAFGLIGLGFDGQTPQDLANAGFPFDYPQTTFDGIIAMTNNSDLSVLDSKTWLTNADQDYCTTVLDLGNSFLTAGPAKDASTNAIYIRVKEFSKSGNEISEGTIDFQLGESNEIAFPADIIQTNDGEILVVANVNDLSGAAKGVRFIKFKI